MKNLLVSPATFCFEIPRFLGVVDVIKISSALPRSKASKDIDDEVSRYRKTIHL